MPNSQASLACKGATVQLQVNDKPVVVQVP